MASADARALIDAIRPLDPDGTGEISLVALDSFLQRLDAWWDAEKIELLSTAAGIMSENGRIRYADFVEWILGPGSVPATPRPGVAPTPRGTRAISQRPWSGLRRTGSSVTLRLVHVNDVYDLMRFPSLKTAIQQLGSSTDADEVVTTMGGDFLAPYLLSQLDHGAGMVECMNNLPISHCCFGNHECDVSHEALLKAIDTFRGKWLNSNMKGGGFGENERLPNHDIFEVVSKDGLHRRRVGMIGLLCDYPYLYREGVFNGAVPSIEPVNDCCARLCQELTGEHGCDIVVPMTHQNSNEDAALAPRGRELKFPVILGGHDHLEVCERYESQGSECTLMKAGMDAVKVGVVDITWDTPSTEWPRVDARLLTTMDFEKDAGMLQVVEKHMAKVWSLDYMVACQRSDMEELTPPGTAFPLSSLGTRAGESSMATFLCTALREALRADVAILEGGSVRAGTDKYVDRVTMSDLKAELPFKNDTLVVTVPGGVLSEAVRTSRVKAGEKGKYAFLLHCDKGCVVDPSTHCLIQVAGEPFAADRHYSVAVGVDLGIGSGVNEPLINWANANQHAVPDKELAMPAGPILEMFFIRRLWEQLPSFQDIDTHQDGYLTYEEIEHAYTSVFFAGVGELDVSQQLAIKQMVQHLVRALDRAGDSRVSKEEYDDLKVKGKPVLFAG